MRKKDKELDSLIKFEKKVVKIIKQQTSKRIKQKIPSIFPEINLNLSIEAFYLNKTGSVDRMYIYNEFWSYLEFQLQFVFVMIFSFPAVLYLFSYKFIILKLKLSLIVILMLLLSLVLLIVARSLLKMASKNYYHHTMKTLSYNIGVHLDSLENPKKNNE